MEYLLTGENPVSTACGPSHPVPEWLSLPRARASHAPRPLSLRWGSPRALSDAQQISGTLGSTSGLSLGLAGTSAFG